MSQPMGQREPDRRKDEGAEATSPLQGRLQIAMDVLVPFLASRLLLFVFVGLSLKVWPIRLIGGQWQAFPECPWLDGWARWDSGWYWTIFSEGYSFRPHGFCNPNFFPLFPWISGVLSLPLRGFLLPPQAFFFGAVVVTNAGMALGLWGLYRLMLDGASPPAQGLATLGVAGAGGDPHEAGGDTQQAGGDTQQAGGDTHGAGGDPHGAGGGTQRARGNTSRVGGDVAPADRQSREAARRAVLLVCFNPFSFYFSAAYTEGLYFAIVVWALYLAGRERWGGACLLGAAAILTRPHGFVVAAVLAVLYAERRRFNWRRVDRHALALLLMPLAALALHALWWASTGEPLAWEKASEAWRAGRGLGAVLREVRGLADGWDWPNFFTVLSLGVLALWGGAVAPVRCRYGWAYALFIVGSLGLSAMSSLEGLGRYALPVFPPYLVAGSALERSRLMGPIVAVCTMLMLVCAYRFSHWFPA